MLSPNTRWFLLVSKTSNEKKSSGILREMAWRNIKCENIIMIKRLFVYEINDISGLGDETDLDKDGY